MRARALPSVAFLLAATPPAMATERAGSLWVTKPIANSASTGASGYVPPRWDLPNLPADTETIVALGAALVITAGVAGFLLRLIYLKSRAILADAKLVLAEKRSQIATLPAPPGNSGASLSAPEIENLLAAGFPEIAPEVRAPLARAIVAAVKDKRGW